MSSNDSSEMIVLGDKWECYSCGAKFYDLGRTPAICPKCEANQDDAIPEPVKKTKKKRKKAKTKKKASSEEE